MRIQPRDEQLRNAVESRELRQVDSQAGRQAHRRAEGPGSRVGGVARESYEFTLRFALPFSEADFSDCEDRLFEAGCDDALLGAGHSGRISLDFIRAARDARTAMLGAIADVRGAIPEAALIEATPDLVGIADVAELVGSSRQNLRQLMLACRTATPSPVHEGNPSRGVSTLLHRPQHVVIRVRLQRWSDWEQGASRQPAQGAGGTGGREREERPLNRNVNPWGRQSD